MCLKLQDNIPREIGAKRRWMELRIVRDTKDDNKSVEETALVRSSWLDAKLQWISGFATVSTKQVASS